MSRAFTFFGSFIDAAAGMPDEDRHSFLDALVAYASDGEVPEDMTPMARAVFTAVLPTVEASMVSHESGKRGGRPRNNPAPAKAERVQEIQPDDGPDGDAPTPSEPPSETPLSNPPSKPSGVEWIGVDRSGVEKEEGTTPPPPFEPPDEGAFIRYFNDLCVKRGIPPDTREAKSSFGWYEDHGWAHKDGTPYRDWRRCAVTCVNRYESKFRHEEVGNDVFAAYA